MNRDDEDDFRVPPMGWDSIERVVDAFAQEVSPAHLDTPGKLDLAAIVDGGLESMGIEFYPARHAELTNAEAVTAPNDDGGATILLRDELFRAVRDGGSSEVFARSTVAHELGHAVMHVRHIRASLRTGALGLKRTSRSDLPHFESAEWQAWAFAGCLLIPRRTIGAMVGQPLREVAATYGVSSAFLAKHLRRFLMRHQYFDDRGFLSRAPAPDRSTRWRVPS